MSEWHVSPHPYGGWQISRPENLCPTGVTDTQQQAIDQVQHMLRRTGGTLVIHQPGRQTHRIHIGAPQ